MCTCCSAVAAKELAAHKEGWRGKAGSFLADARVLASHPVYVLTVAGTAIYVGACCPLPVHVPVGRRNPQPL